MQLPSELAFLEAFYIDPVEKYRQAEWLLNDFDAPTWIYSFGYRTPKELSWDVQLEDGSSLLEERHRDLLNGFRYWLVIATERKKESGANALHTQKGCFHKTLNLIDHFLLHAEQFTLAKTGLAGISTDELKALLTKLASSARINTSLFDWEERLSTYLLRKVQNSDPKQLDALLEQHPHLQVLMPEQEDSNTLSIDVSLIPRVRAWLFSEGCYPQSSLGKVNCTKLAAEIYANTLNAKSTRKPSPDILYCPKSQTHVGRERPGVAINRHGSNNKLCEQHHSKYVKALYCLSSLHILSIPAPSIESFRTIQSFTPQVSKLGRFLTLPSQVVFDALRNAIEFHLKYGKALVDSYCRLSLAVKAAHRAGNHGARLVNLTQAQFDCAIDPKLTELGVTELGLSVILKPGARGWQPTKGSTKHYYQKLRDNRGLLELMAVYVGCAQVVLGALMARRQGEMLALCVDTCLDKSESWLLFEKEKSTSGVFGLRDQEARPIDPIAVKMIKQLWRMQRILKRIGVIDELGPLFSTAQIKGEMALYAGPHRYNDNFDLFCDYFEGAGNDLGKRYYIRQHLLRRFFAMLFFHSSAFGGVDTLRWMLGHTDLEHVWHYITESTPGAVLRGTTAQWSAENLSKLAEGDTGYQALAELIHDRFGVKNVFLLETADLEAMIEDLLEEGAVEIEPEFFEDASGKRMRVMCKVVHQEAGNDA
ncbi:MAG: hypothetical protein V7707_18335 [Motiliproteus sp.]